MRCAPTTRELAKLRTSIREFLAADRAEFGWRAGRRLAGWRDGTRTFPPAWPAPDSSG